MASNVILYPIPSNETLAVESPYKIEGMRIFDALGQEVLSNFNATTIDITYLTSGIYFLKAETDQGSIVKRFTKE